MDRKQNSVKGRKNLVAAAILVVALAILPAAAALAQDDLKYPDPYSQGYYERLDYYASMYPNEIYRFCVGRFRQKIRSIRSCLRNQQDARDAVFANAQRKLGTRSLVQAVYDDCLDHHPDYGVGRIGACVETRLMLRDKVQDDSIERIIYQKCESKWRHSGVAAIDVCCAHEGRYYRDNGRLRA